MIYSVRRFSSHEQKEFGRIRDTLSKTISEEERKKAKENMDNALRMYKSNSKIEWRKRLINSKIPQWLL